MKLHKHSTGSDHKVDLVSIGILLFFKVFLYEAVKESTHKKNQNRRQNNIVVLA